MAQCYSQIDITIPNGSKVRVNCNKCNFCLQNRKKDWSFRLHWEARRAPTAHFITATYDPEHVPIMEDEDKMFYMSLDKQHLFSFHKLLKQEQNRQIRRLSKKFKWSRERTQSELKYWKIRYYAVGEYGTKYHRPHYHSILFGLHPNTLKKLPTLWKKGHVYVGTVTTASIGYCTKYLIDNPHEDRRTKPFTVMSRNPGLGSNYLTKEMRAWHREDTRHYVMYQGYKQRMPRYYKDQTFSKLEKETNAAVQKDEALQREYEEIIRLSELSDDPIRLYYEQIQQTHERIRTKSLALNTL